MSASLEMAKENKKFYIVVAITIAIMIGFGYIPPIGEHITTQGMRILGIFLGMVFAWTFGYTAVPSMLAFIICGLFYPGKTIDGIFIAAFGNSVVWMIVFACIFVYGLNKCGILEWISGKILSIKLVSKSPWHLAMGLWLCSFVCTAFCTITVATTLFMFSIFTSIADKVGIKRRSAYAAYVMVFIAGFAAISVGSLPYSSAIMTVLGFMRTVDPALDFPIPIVCAINTIFSLAFWVIAGIISKVAFKTFAKPEFTLDGAVLVDDVKKADKKVITGLVYVVILLGIMVTPMLLPAGNPIKVFLSGFGMAGAFAVVVVAMSLTSIDGERLFNIEECFRNGAVNWHVFFIMTAAFSMGAIMIGPETGFTELILDVLDTMTGDISLFTLSAILLILLLIITNIINNGVAAQLVVPIITIACLSKGINPGLFVGIAAIIMDYGLVLPSGCPQAAVVHGYTEWMKSSQVYKYALFSVVIVAICVVAVGTPVILFFM